MNILYLYKIYRKKFFEYVHFFLTNEKHRFSQLIRIIHSSSLFNLSHKGEQRSHKRQVRATKDPKRFALINSCVVKQTGPRHVNRILSSCYRPRLRLLPWRFPSSIVAPRFPFNPNDRASPGRGWLDICRNDQPSFQPSHVTIVF